MAFESKRIRVFLALAAVAALCGCGADADPGTPPPGPVAGASATPAASPAHDPAQAVAVVNGKTLSWGEMDKRAQSLFDDEHASHRLYVPPERRDEALLPFRRQAVNVFVNKVVMLDEADRRGIHATEEQRAESLEKLGEFLEARGMTLDQFFHRKPFTEEEIRREFEDGMRIDLLKEQEVLSKITVTPAEMDALAGEIVAFRSERRREAEALRQRLLDGEDFAELARTASECPSRRTGGDLGDFRRGGPLARKMTQAFEDAAFAQAVGEIGPVIETPLGYHILRVTSRTPAREATDSLPAIPETVRAAHILLRTPPVPDGPALQAEIVRRKFAEGVGAFYSNLLSRATIQILIPLDGDLP
ncbi:MAG: peptidylprolyl isomerase [Kiritimatiellia bacterium]|jgi:hypothetical protein